MRRRKLVLSARAAPVPARTQSPAAHQATQVRRSGQVDSYEWNKIAGWVLAAAISVLGLSILTGYMFPVHYPETAAYVVQGVEADASAGGAAAEAEKPIEFYLASADPAKGEAQFKKCASCHSIDKGGAAGIGPNLYGIVGEKHGAAPGFGYSEALKATGDKVWDWQGLAAWLANPKQYIPGNKMSFAGISKPEDRANLIAYLNTKDDSPLPMPAAPAETAAPAPAAGADAAATPAADGAAPAAAPAA
jgi:cytochrome c